MRRRPIRPRRGYAPAKKLREKVLGGGRGLQMKKGKMNIRTCIGIFILWMYPGSVVTPGRYSGTSFVCFQTDFDRSRDLPGNALFIENKANFEGGITLFCFSFRSRKNHASFTSHDFQLGSGERSLSPVPKGKVPYPRYSWFRRKQKISADFTGFWPAFGIHFREPTVEKGHASATSERQLAPRT